MPNTFDLDHFNPSSDPDDPSLSGPNDAPLFGHGGRIQDLAEPLKWIGIGLLGTYVATVVAVALPVKLLDPIWINRICGSIRGGVSFPLEAMALIMIGAYLQRGVKEPPMVTKLRRLCSWVALGFMLMIPLQTWAGQKLIDLAVENQQVKIQPSINSFKAVYAATNAEQLIEAIQLIPGAPPNIRGRLEEPVAKVRERLISQIEPQLLEQKQQLYQVISEIRYSSLIALAKDGIVAFFSALAFAAIGRRNMHQSTLLQKLLGHPLPPATTMEQLAGLTDQQERT
jgi:hypothetical protein